VVVACAAALDPRIYLRELELPEPTNAMSRKATGLNPTIDRVLRDPEVAGHFVDGNPRLRHRVRT
jgi:hypothetical protein